MPIYIEEEQESAIPYVMLVIILIVSAAVGYLWLDREPVKEKQRYVVIKSIGQEHKWVVDGKNVRIEYEEVE